MVLNCNPLLKEVGEGGGGGVGIYVKYPHIFNNNAIITVFFFPLCRYIVNKSCLFFVL